MGAINLAVEFSRTPGLRYRDESEFSGEEFREDVLAPAYLSAARDGETLTVYLDGTAGLATSFLEESFGGLIRQYPDREQDIRERVVVVAVEEPYLLDEVRRFMRDARTYVGRKKSFPSGAP